MSDDPNRGCAYTAVFSPGYVHDKIIKKSPVVNSFFCNHALDVYQLTFSFYELLFHDLLIFKALYLPTYNEDNLYKICGNFILLLLKTLLILKISVKSKFVLLIFYLSS